MATQEGWLVSNATAASALRRSWLCLHREQMQVSAGAVCLQKLGVKHVCSETQSFLLCMGVSVIRSQLCVTLVEVASISSGFGFGAVTQPKSLLPAWCLLVRQTESKKSVLIAVCLRILCSAHKNWMQSGILFEVSLGQKMEMLQYSWELVALSYSLHV